LPKLTKHWLRQTETYYPIANLFWKKNQLLINRENSAFARAF